MSAYSGSAASYNFYQTAMIPQSSEVSAEAAGQCLVNIDGACIRGGVRISTGGYGGIATDKCYTTGLFAGGNKRYAIQGWGVSNNTIPLKVSRPLI